MTLRAFLVSTILGLGSTAMPAAARVDRGDIATDLPGRAMELAPGPERSGATPPRREPERPRQKLAHAIVVRTSPEQSGIASGTIGRVEVWYDAGIRNDFAALAVIDGNGERVDKRDAAIDRSDQSHVTASVGVLAPGTYTVRYRAMSADGHLVSGAWVFEVRPE